MHVIQIYIDNPQHQFAFKNIHDEVEGFSQSHSDNWPKPSRFKLIKVTRLQFQEFPKIQFWMELP